MRLWHEDLLEKLPKQWLMGQHRECCALRGKGWGKPHTTVNYVFKHNYLTLFHYHTKVMSILKKTYKVNIDQKWQDYNYRGKILSYQPNYDLPNINTDTKISYPEHNQAYLTECIENLAAKGINIKLQEN